MRNVAVALGNWESPEAVPRSPSRAERRGAAGAREPDSGVLGPLAEGQFEFAVSVGTGYLSAGNIPEPLRASLGADDNIGSPRRRIAARGADGRLQVIDLKGDMPRMYAHGGGDTVWAAAFLRGGREVLSYQSNGDLVRRRLKGTGSGTVVGNLSSADPENDSNDVGDAVLSEDGRYLAVAFEQEPLVLWDVEAGSALLASDRDGGLSDRLALSANGAALVHTDRISTRVWDLDRRRSMEMACAIVSASLGPEFAARACTPPRR